MKKREAERETREKKGGNYGKLKERGVYTGKTDLEKRCQSMKNMACLTALSKV